MQHAASTPALSLPGELNSRLSSDTKLMSLWLPLNANVLLRSLVKVLGLFGFMLSLSPRLTLLSLLQMPLTIAAEKVYNARHLVSVDAGEPPRGIKAAVLAGFRRPTTPDGERAGERGRGGGGGGGRERRRPHFMGRE